MKLIEILLSMHHNNPFRGLNADTEDDVEPMLILIKCLISSQLIGQIDVNEMSNFARLAL